MVSRRRFIAAALWAALGPITVAGANGPTPCCPTPADQPHSFGCPVALARTCQDCGAEPGEDCHFSCSAFWS